MANIADWRQANADIALIQGGSAGVPRTAFVLGAKSGQPVLYYWDELKRLFTQGSTEHNSYWSDYLGAIAAAPEGITEDTEGTTPGDITVTSSDLTLVTSSDTANAHTTATLGLHWTVSDGPTIFDTRFAVDSVGNVAVEVGLSDALSETNGFAFSDHTVAGVTAVADDAIVLAFDSAGDSNFNILAVNGAGTPVAFDSGVAPTASTYVTLRMVVDASGNVDVYLNGTLLQTVSSAVATTAALTFWLSVTTLTTAAKTLSVDYVGLFAER